MMDLVKALKRLDFCFTILEIDREIGLAKNLQLIKIVDLCSNQQQ